MYAALKHQAPADDSNDDDDDDDHDMHEKWLTIHFVRARERGLFQRNKNCIVKLKQMLSMAND